MSTLEGNDVNVYFNIVSDLAPEDMINEALIDGADIFQSEMHSFVSKDSLIGDESYFGGVISVHVVLMEAFV